MEYDLSRHEAAQASSYASALTEIRSGRKRSHWIWYIFPQLKGLGFSHNATFYGLDGLQEATDYLAHPVLGPRLVAISQALLDLPGNNPTTVMGSRDDLKLFSSMTLFALVPGADPVFQKVLDKFFQGRRDERTVEMIAR